MSNLLVLLFIAARCAYEPVRILILPLAFAGGNSQERDNTEERKPAFEVPLHLCTYLETIYPGQRGYEERHFCTKEVYVRGMALRRSYVTAIERERERVLREEYS